jgi:spore coat protein U-like protein
MRTSRLIGTVLVAGATASTIVAGTARLGAASSASTTLSASATVMTNCKIDTNDVTFAQQYDPLSSSALTGTGTVTITCTKGAAATVGLSAGANAAHAVGTTRAMAGGSDYLSYDLFQDSGYSSVWGNTTGTLLSPGAADNKTPRPFTVYANIPAGQDITGGKSYSDSLQATVNF